MTPTAIPHSLRDMAFDRIADLIEATGNESGVALVEAQRARMDAARCRGCARHAATATIRVWLARYKEAHP